MARCDHPGLHLGGWCYFDLKRMALNGHRSNLTLEQCHFVGFDIPTPDSTGWSSLTPLASSPVVDPEELRDLRHVIDIGQGGGP